MYDRLTLKSWSYTEDPQKIKLEYEDGDAFLIDKKDFDRAFGAIASASKEDVIRDYLRPALDDVLNRAQEKARVRNTPDMDRAGQEQTAQSTSQSYR